MGGRVVIGASNLRSQNLRQVAQIHPPDLYFFEPSRLADVAFSVQNDETSAERSGIFSTITQP